MTKFKVGDRVVIRDSYTDFSGVRGEITEYHSEMNDYTVFFDKQFNGYKWECFEDFELIPLFPAINTQNYEIE